MALAYFILAVAVLAGILAGCDVWAHTRNRRYALAVGVVSTLLMGVVGALVALGAMMIWPPPTRVPN
jgi:hypothetical protein